MANQSRQFARHYATRAMALPEPYPASPSATSQCCPSRICETNSRRDRVCPQGGKREEGGRRVGSGADPSERGHLKSTPHASHKSLRDLAPRPFLVIQNLNTVRADDYCKQEHWVGCNVLLATLDGALIRESCLNNSPGVLSLALWLVPTSPTFNNMVVKTLSRLAKRSAQASFLACAAKRSSRSRSSRAMRSTHPRSSRASARLCCSVNMSKWLSVFALNAAASSFQLRRTARSKTRWALNPTLPVLLQLPRSRWIGATTVLLCPFREICA